MPLSGFVTQQHAQPGAVIGHPHSLACLNPVVQSNIPSTALLLIPLFVQSPAVAAWFSARWADFGLAH